MGLSQGPDAGFEVVEMVHVRELRCCFSAIHHVNLTRTLRPNLTQTISTKLMLCLVHSMGVPNTAIHAPITAIAPNNNVFHAWPPPCAETAAIPDWMA